MGLRLLPKIDQMTTLELQGQIAAAEVANAALRERVAALEKAHRQQRLSIFTLFMILIGALLLSQSSSQQVFSGRWWAIHDKQKHITAWFDDDGLQLKDAKGTVRVKLGLSPSGAPTLQFFDEQSHVRAQLFQYTDGSAYLMLWDKDGKGVRYPPSATPMP